ncbi:MAG: hypothetical protein ACYTF0_00125 [Planctomycetota bacterium]|jgi:hypothetical protein
MLRNLVPGLLCITAPLTAAVDSTSGGLLAMTSRFGAAHQVTAQARSTSRVEALYHQIHRFSTDLEVRVLAGDLARPTQTYTVTNNESGRPQTTTNERVPLNEELQLADLLGQLAILQQQLPFANHREASQLTNCWRSLEQASRLLNLGLSSGDINRLEELHAAWTNHYQMVLAKTKAEHALDLLANEDMSPAKAIELANSAVTEVDYPTMKLDGLYPQVVIPVVMPPMPSAAPVIPEPAPQAMPAVKPEPAPTTPVSQPKPEPEVSEQPAVEPEPQPEPALPAMPKGGSDDQAAADALFQAASDIYQEAVNTEDFDQRDDLYNQAQLVFDAAVERYQALSEATPGDEALDEQLRQANQLRYGCIKQARKPAADNAAAARAAKDIIANALSAGPAVAAEPVSEEVVEEPVAEEPMVEEVAEEPVAEEPMVEEVVEEPVAEEPTVEEVAEEPATEEAVEEPAAEKPAADSKKDDDLDWDL